MVRVVHVHGLELIRVVVDHREQARARVACSMPGVCHQVGVAFSPARAVLLRYRSIASKGLRVDFRVVGSSTWTCERGPYDSRTSARIFLGLGMVRARLDVLVRQLMWFCLDWGSLARGVRSPLLLRTTG